MSGKAQEKGESAEKKSFEAILKRLEQIVGKLGQGDLPLEQSLQLFEEGVGLSRDGHAILDEAERKVEVLLASGETAPVERAEGAGERSGDG